MLIYMKTLNQTSKISNTGNLFLNIVPQICAIMVVVLHQYNVQNMPSHSVANHIVGFISHGICTAAVPTFFCISGFLFWRTVTSFGSIKEKLWRRVKSVLVPFVLWNIAYALVLITLKNEWGKVNLNEVISSVLLYKYYFPMWYMFQLMVFFLLSPMIYLFMRRSTYMVLLLVSLIIITVFVTSSVSFEFHGLNRSAIQFNFLIYYLLGALVTKFNMNLSTIRLPHLVTCIILFLVISYISSLCMDEYLSVGSKRVFVLGVFVAFVALMIKFVQQYPVKVDLLFGVSPMAIYGMHGFVGVMINAFFTLIKWEHSLLRYMVICLLCVLFSILLCWVFKRVAPRFYSIFVGNR